MEAMVEGTEKNETFVQGLRREAAEMAALAARIRPELRAAGIGEDTLVWREMETMSILATEIERAVDRLERGELPEDLDERFREALKAAGIAVKQ